MQEDYEESISLTLRTWSSRKSSKMQGENWKHQWLQLCLARHARKNKHWETRGKTNEIKSKFACILEASESTRMRMEESLPNYHEDHIAGRGPFTATSQFGTQIYSYASSYENSCSKSSGGQGMGKLEKFSAWNLTKVRNKSEVIEEARTSGVTVHSASLVDICHLKNAELETKHQKHKGRVVLRGDIVKDDSGSSAVFAEQGSSASQMTAARVTISYPDCQDAQDKQRTQYLLIPRLKWKMLQKLLKIPKSECPDIWIRLPRHKMAKIMVQYERPSRAKSVWSSFGRTVMGKAIWENPIEIWLGEGFQLGMPIRTPWKRNILICVCGWHQIGWKETNVHPMWKLLNKEVDLGEPRSFLDHVYLGCTQRQCEISKDIVDNYRTMFESRISAAWTEKLPYSENLRISSWSLWHGWSCKEVCGTILWVGEQDDSTTLQSINSMHRWPPLQRRRNKICWRIVKYMLSNCSEMLILGTYWTARYSMVSK